MTNKKSGEENFNKKSWLSEKGELVVDVFKTGDHLVIQAPIAGISKEDLEIVTEKDIVTIKGERSRPGEQPEEVFTEECFWGEFAREIVMPEETDPGRAEASMEQGVLTIRIPIIEKEQRKKIDLEDD